MSSAPDPPTAEDAARELRLALARLDAHVANTPLAVIEWDGEFRTVRWNEQAERVFGWTAAEVLGKRPFDWRFVLDEDRARAQELMTQVARDQKSQNLQRWRNYTKSGALVWCEWHNSILRDAGGQIVSILSLVLDVTDRTSTAEALAVSEARVRAALGSAKMLAWDLDLHTNRWHTTADLTDFYGLPRGPDYSDAANALAAVHPDDVPVVLAGRSRAIATGEPLAYDFRGAVPVADGSARWFQTRGQMLRDATGAPRQLVAVTTEITDQKRADEERAALNRQLEDARRWESLGVLAGGIAHDFNNILTVVMGSAALARRGMPEQGPTARYLDQIERASGRAADVCRQMLAYAGRAVPTGTRADLVAVAREAAAHVALSAPQLSIRFEFPTDLPAARVDPAQARQLVLNLLTNAAECGAPQVVVKGERDDVPDTASDSGFRLAPPPGAYVVLTVSDTGPGMTAEVRDRMFDPFFTTKFPGRGLGLAAVLGIARAHKGGIRAVTAPGRGTSVSVYLPLADAAAPRSPLHAPRPAV